MSRKGKRAQKAKKAAPAPVVAPTPEPIEPIAAGSVEWVWLLGAIFVVAGVSLYFQLNVNRVFDVPKAAILKVGGCLLFAAWLLNALYGTGVRWRSAAVFAPPVAALALAVTISTFFSIDVATSFNGVYERQFGLQGFLACVGLFFLTATSLHGKRGAWLALGVLASLGGTIGVYAFFQANGWDPWPFFWNRPFNKVYAFLGNATFAGNALALITPMVTVAAGVATAVTLGGRQRRESLSSNILPWILGFAFVLFWQIVPARYQALEALGLSRVPTFPPRSLNRMFVIGVSLGPLLLLGAGLFGSWGPPSFRLGKRQHRYWADAVGAGALCAMVVGIVMGLLFTRTRGAWVGTGVAIAAGLVLMPRLADGTRWYRATKMACWGTAAAAALAFVIYVGFPGTVCGPKDKSSCWLYAETIRSIPAAFDPTRTDYGKGQGTRRYLWTESPRVLVNHTQTLQRAYDDRADYANYVDPAKTKELGLRALKPPSQGYMSFDQGWRAVVVWVFGIGIETYRYAFMSHKSLRLEALDPMTNHDNPHNNYLYVLASFGLAGLAAYVWLLWRLLSQAFRRFMASPRPLIEAKKNDDPQPGLVDGWRFEEAGRNAKGKLILATEHFDEVTNAIRDAHPEWTVTAADGEIVVRGHEPDSVLSSLGEISTSVGGSRVDRAMAFGVVTSFFSYAVYSIAGFDSVACSVFLFFLLGVAAALFRPNHDQAPRRLLDHVRGQWANFRGTSEDRVPAWMTRATEIVMVGVLVPLLLFSAYRATVVLRAERALVGNQRRMNNPARLYEAKIERAMAAVRINPFESFYKQSLGNAYGDAARFYDAQVRRNKSEKDAKNLRLKAAQYRDKAEQALYAALDHAWAPENVFISLFQLYYHRFNLSRKMTDLLKAERALERALVHSPHLGAVRANLAALQLERKALDKALANALWVTRVSPNNSTGWRVAGRVYQLQGDVAKAKKHLDLAVSRSKGKDSRARRYLTELETSKSKTEPAKPKTDQPKAKTETSAQK